MALLVATAVMTLKAITSGLRLVGNINIANTDL
jgi:hypothetical protein